MQTNPKSGQKFNGNNQRAFFKCLQLLCNDIILLNRWNHKTINGCKWNEIQLNFNLTVLFYCDRKIFWGCEIFGGNQRRKPSSHQLTPQKCLRRVWRTFNAFGFAFDFFATRVELCL